MKLNTTSRIILSTIAVAVASLQSSCSTQNAEAWNKIQNEGLIPYLVDGQSSPARQLDDVPVEPLVLEDQQPRELRLDHSGVVTAQEVPGSPGFVYSPHTPDPLQVDVRDFEPGESVRCPYTKKSFIVPGKVDVIQPDTPDLRIATNTRPEPSPKPAPIKIAAQPSPPQKKVEPTPSSPIVTPKIEEPKKIVADSVPLDPKPITGIPKTDKLPTEGEALALAKKDEESVPVGKRVEGKPNYVFSPFAASNQVVDVEGHAPGTKVKCPYTGKIFAVPAE